MRWPCGSNASHRVTFAAGSNAAQSISSREPTEPGRKRVNSHSACLGPLPIHALPMIQGRRVVEEELVRDQSVAPPVLHVTLRHPRKLAADAKLQGSPVVGFMHPSNLRTLRVG
jgi:hypothetical protein